MEVQSFKNKNASGGSDQPVSVHTLQASRNQQYMQNNTCHRVTLSTPESMAVRDVEHERDWCDVTGSYQSSESLTVERAGLGTDSGARSVDSALASLAILTTAR